MKVVPEPAGTGAAGVEIFTPSSATSNDATPETPARGDVPGGAPNTLTATERRERREAAACAAEMRRDLESARKRPREEEGL